MGGALAARAAAAAAATGALPTLRGVALLDIVEGTALAAAPAMRAALAARPARFPDAFAARAWARASPAASPSLLSQLVPAPDGAHGLVWRTPLLETAQFWDGWFRCVCVCVYPYTTSLCALSCADTPGHRRGLGDVFLGLRHPKLLLLADTDRLDAQLMVAQMQVRAAGP
jgi:protein phosphatase methylesterase 1